MPADRSTLSEGQLQRADLQCQQVSATDEAVWPKGRDFAMFKDWFAVELHSLVEDLCDFEIVDEDDEAE
jgi:hypothetical protein